MLYWLRLMYQYHTQCSVNRDLSVGLWIDVCDNSLLVIIFVPSNEIGNILLVVFLNEHGAKLRNRKLYSSNHKTLMKHLRDR